MQRSVSAALQAMMRIKIIGRRFEYSTKLEVTVLSNIPVREIVFEFGLQRPRWWRRDQ